MNNLKFLTGICLTAQLLLLSACSSDSTLAPEVREPATTAAGYSIPLADALKVADAFMANIDGGTRAGRTVCSVEVKTSERTRANASMPDTLLYLINYEGDSGFALVSADRRLPAIYAISDEGHFEFSDTLRNDGLNFFMKTVDNSISYSIDTADTAIGDSGWVTPNWPTGDYYDQFKFYYSVIKPMFNDPMNRISQYPPYNAYCYWNNTKQVAGCVPVAFATFMSYFKWPAEYKGTQIPWDEIIAGENNNALALLIRDLWDSENLEIGPRYDSRGQFIGMGTDSTRYIPTLENMGYIVPDGFKSFNQSEMIQVLTRGIDLPRNSPILARGTVGSLGQGHAWIIDGAMWQHGNPGNGDVKPIIPHYNSDIPMCLFHCVWGWGGKQNGFFNFDSNVIGGNPDYFGEEDNTPSGIPYIFDTELKYIGYVKRNK